MSVSVNSYFPYQANSLFYEPMTTGQPVFVSDTQNDPRWRLMPDTFHTVRAWIGVPLIVWDITIGLLSVGSLQPHAYDTDDVETARTFARQVALAIETSRIYSQLETSLVDLQQMRMRLTQTERLAMAGEIAAGIAHQIRNPLTAIVADLSAEADPSDGPARQALEIIRRSSYRAGTGSALIGFCPAQPVHHAPVGHQSIGPECAGPGSRPN
jgi:signal transduction protein with GAF and PtsI domain